MISCTGTQSDHYEPELVYASDQTHANLGIFITDTSYTNVREVFQDTTTTAYGLQWASENEVLFVFYQTGNTEIMSLNLETGETTNLSNHPAKDGSPQLSPDGKLLAFTSHRDVEGRYGSGDEIYLVEIGTTDTTRITFNETYDSGIRFSRDGSQLTFCRQVNREESNGEIFIMRPDGSDKRRITTHEGRDEIAEWKPF